jgi:hypothetical protein
MDTNNLFIGMNSDISKHLENNDKYLKALNLRPTSNLGSGNGSLTNIKGNNCEITFPIIREVYKFKILKVYDSSNVFQKGIINININGQTTADINIYENTKTSDIISYIKKLPNCYNGIYSVNYTFTTSFNNDYIYIYQNPEYKLCNSINSANPVISITTVQAGSKLQYIDSTGTVSNSNVPYITSYSSSNPLVIIGSTYINNNIYMLTCHDNNSNKTGQLWELTYNELIKSSTLKLLYNNYITLNKDFPIPPIAFQGRYEIPSIQRIYWSDNNNYVRSINVKDNNVFAIEPDFLNLRASIKMSIPTIYQIHDGQATNNLICSNSYQCSYRLIKNNTEITNYSVCSNMINLIPQPTSNFISPQPNFSSLEGGTASVNKAIEWEINGIDTSYDTIEFFIIIQDYNTPGFYTVFKYQTLSINGKETLRTKFTNDTDNMIEISLSEFLIENISFTHCGTIEQKDNRLFYGNVKNSLSNYLDTYDARAFRFNLNSNEIRVKKFESDNTYSTYDDSDYNLININDDNIPLLNLGMDVSDDVLYNNNFKYLKNSSIIGGEGPNIKFKFGTVLLRTDMVPTLPNQASLGDSSQGTTRDNNSSSQVYKNGYRMAGGNSQNFSPFKTNNAPFQKYYASGNDVAFNTMGLEYFGADYKSYQHNEIYRFAIVFKSKTGNSSFSKFIADIKFPNYSDSCDSTMRGSTTLGNKCPDFRSMFYDSSGAYSVLPYINFEVNIPEEFSKLISGFEIVRVERKIQDRTVCEHGLINQIMNFNGDNGFLPISHYLRPNGTDSMNPVSSTLSGGANPKMIAFHPFSYLVDETSNIDKDDKLIITEKYIRTINNAVWPFSSSGPGGSFESYYYNNKYYDFNAFIYNNPSFSSSSIKKVKASDYIPLGGTKIIDGLTINNFDRNFLNQTYSLGSPKIAMVLDNTNTIIWSDYNSGGNNVAVSGSSDSNSKLLAIHFKPSNLISQYGGRTALSRDNSEYISTGSYYRIDFAGSKNINVFGGDMFHGILDIHKALKNYSGSGRPLPSDGTTHSQAWFFPTQSVYNIDLRSGNKVNSDLNISGSSADFYDQYFYNKGYSMSNSLYKYLPKPSNFNETNEFGNRIYWSNVKINGEPDDSWSILPANNYYDLDGSYGSITGLINLKNNMYAIQSNALAMLMINPVSVITDGNNQPLNLGSSGTLDKHLYHSVDIGTNHKWSISKSNDAITFTDVIRKKIYLFNGQTIDCISDKSGNRGVLNKLLHDYILINDNPIIGKGILTTYDYFNNEFLYTFLNLSVLGEDFFPEKYTLVYSDLINSFSGFYSFTPYIYINNHFKIFSPRDYSNGLSTKLYLHDVGEYGKFYDNIEKSSLKFIVNNNPVKTKIFDNITINTESIKDNRTSYDDILDNITYSDNVNNLKDTINRIRVYNEYQNTDFVELNSTNLKKVEQGWNVQIPRNKVNLDSNAISTYSIFNPSVLTKTLFGDRIRDKYIIIDLEYDNINNNRFIINNTNTKFRISDR